MTSEMPYLGAKRTRIAPSEHHLVGGSFVHLPAAELREPEQLVLEIMREVFFDLRSQEKGPTRELTPEGNEATGLSDNERAALYALKGRKKGKQVHDATHYYAPAYPCLASHGWLRSNQAAVLNNFLFAGPIRQHLWGPGRKKEDSKAEQSHIVSEIVGALHGTTITGTDGKKADFLADILSEKINTPNKNDAQKRLLEKICSGSSKVLEIEDDELAKRITRDIISICQLEGKIPRMQWIQLLMTFLRFAPMMWLLSQLKVPRIVLDNLLKAIDTEDIPKLSDIRTSIKERNRGMLVPNNVPTRELYDHIEKYVKARVELDILLYCLDVASGDSCSEEQLTLQRQGSKIVPLENLLVRAKNSKSALEDLEQYKSVALGFPFRVFLTREGENFKAWKSPLSVGVGKQINEAFRVLREAPTEEDDDGGYLFSARKGAIAKGLIVFPGPLLLKTVVYLAAKSSQGKRGGGGRLMLHDVESHFECYGVNFSASADSRTRLMHRLQELGLLTGSPDAGTSVAVANPYPFR